MINLEIPKKLQQVGAMAHSVAEGMFRPISRKYDRLEHVYPAELDVLRSILQGMEDGGTGMGADGLSQEKKSKSKAIKNGSNMAVVLNMMEICWGDSGLALTIPGQGLGNAAIAAVATPEQKKRFAGKWAAMAITEPDAGSDSAAIHATAQLDDDEWVINGEKIFVTCGERADLVVVWASLDKSLGRAAIKSFVVEKGSPGMKVTHLEKKLGIRASDTATIIFDNCRIPRNNILGSESIDTKKSFAGVMKTFDNTRPVVAAMSVGVATAALDLTKELLSKEGLKFNYQGNRFEIPSIESEIYRMEADLEAARLLMFKAAWMADNGKPNSKEASMAKAKAGRVGNEITLRCVELCGSSGYSENYLLEKWARDSKIFDIFEGTQQIQQLVVARRLLKKSSKDLK
jgi:acyl-CoA dehydrogenase